MNRAIHAVGASALAAAGAGMVVAAVAGLTISVDGGTAAETGLDAGPFVVAPVGALAATSFGYTVLAEARQALRADGFDLTRTDLGNAAAVAVAAPLTYALSVRVGVGPVVASALVGLCAHRLTETRDAPAYCGSFVGMATPAADADFGSVVAAGAATAVVFVLAKRSFNGFGGKLGTTAFVGCLSVGAVGGLAPGTGSVPEPTAAAGLIVAAAVAAHATFAVSVRLGRGPVVGSAVVGLIAGVVCPPLLAGGDAVAAVAFCASFVGMTAPERIPTPGAMLLAGGAAGVAFVGSAPYFVGFGGKLGTIAFAACLATAGLLSLGRLLAPAGSDAVTG
ncbi:hypothetical protein C464_02023 [Halorubrum coriense DSM 10284]|uniref:Uncharacterized protein n=1 Tax=Halorubrum coriense DSM 10284 TaxID=1227466 RepID=M0ES64_9EURY|nr:hypothetical protein [Halorubrum coriense]ELZ50631.1 hypothetical protein C464_02023 [Halorubrum coriense DSM 10284]